MVGKTKLSTTSTVKRTLSKRPWNLRVVRIFDRSYSGPELSSKLTMESYFPYPLKWRANITAISVAQGNLRIAVPIVGLRILSCEFSWHK